MKMIFVKIVPTQFPQQSKLWITTTWIATQTLCQHNIVSSTESPYTYDRHKRDGEGWGNHFRFFCYYMIEHKAPPPPLLMAHAKLASKNFITHNLFLMTLWEHLIITILSSVLFRRAILIFLNQYSQLYINQKSFLTGLEVFYSYFSILCI